MIVKLYKSKTWGLQGNRTVSWRTWSVPECCLPRPAEDLRHPPHPRAFAGRPRSPLSWWVSVWGGRGPVSSPSPPRELRPTPPPQLNMNLRPPDCQELSTACTRCRTPVSPPAPGPRPGLWLPSSSSRYRSRPGGNYSQVSSVNWRHLSESGWEVRILSSYIYSVSTSSISVGILSILNIAISVIQVIVKYCIVVLVFVLLEYWVFCILHCICDVLVYCNVGFAVKYQ